MAVEFTPLNSNSITNIDTNFQRVDTALQDAVSRSGTNPNQMNADFDMNSNDILNVGTIQALDISIDGGDVNGILQRAEDAVEESEANAERAEDAAILAEAYANLASPAAVYSGFFSGNGVSTIFSMLTEPVSASHIFVEINGVGQDTNDYTFNGTSLIFNEPPIAGTDNIFYRIIAIAEGVDVPPDGSVTENKLANNAVSLSKMQTIGTNKVLGRDTAGTGNVEELPASELGLDLIAAADATSAKTLLEITAGTWVPIESRAITVATPTANFINLGAYNRIRISGYLVPANDGVTLRMRSSTNNGSSYDSGASDYQWQYLRGTGTTVDTAVSSTDYAFIHGFNVGNVAPESVSFDLVIYQFNKTTNMFYTSNSTGLDGATTFSTSQISGRRIATTARNALSIFFSAGNIASGSIIIEGAIV